MTSKGRHSGAGRNPAKTSSPRSGQHYNLVSQREKLSDCLDSGLHPQGVRRGCRELKPQQHTQRRNDGFGGYFK
ncbi:hypothetical protein GALL_100650 [mine drainage metagenome]|uniref:Uncharacterized protein n=1 Tax=mine drainage metagenome TaxID=410659 RepID=A0A1J5SH92_9ZZZZ